MFNIVFWSMQPCAQCASCMNRERYDSVYFILCLGAREDMTVYISEPGKGCNTFPGDEGRYETLVLLGMARIFQG